MNHPEILRHSGPHTVEMSAGTKDASRRQSGERHAAPTSELHSDEPAWHSGLDHAPVAAPFAQLMPLNAESSDEWLDEEVIFARLEKLRQRNIQLTQSLKQLSSTVSREDPHE